MHGRPWSIVLAGGEGSRLRELTTRAGVSVPKQFCSLTGGPSLLGETLRRAEGLSPRDRILVVVSASHERFWRDELRGLPPENVIVQPEARGTAVGLLLPLLSILQRDPGGDVIALPSDHHVDDEAALRRAFASALVAVRAEPGRIALLGITPDAPDPQYGWIVPEAPLAEGEVRGIELFVEKPDLETAVSLQTRGALWSSFLVATSALGMLHAFEDAQPELVRAFDGRPLRKVYRDLPSVDFSRGVLERVPGRLVVLRVPPCGWSDLGTPERIARVVRAVRLPARAAAAARGLGGRVPVLSRALESLAT